MMALFEFLVSFAKIFRDKNSASIIIKELKSQNEILIQQVENEKVLTEFKDRASINQEIQILKNQIHEKDVQLDSLTANYNQINDYYKNQIDKLRNRISEQESFFRDYAKIENDMLEYRELLEKERERNKDMREILEKRLENLRNTKEIQERTENDIRILLNYFKNNSLDLKYSNLTNSAEINEIIKKYS